MRHINLFSGGPKSGVLGGGQKVYVEKVYVLFLSLNLGGRGSKPEGFPTCFGKGPDCVADPFGNALVGANRPRKRKRTNQVNRGPPTTHHPHKGPSSSSGSLGWGRWCANCRNLRKRPNTYHPQFCTRDVDRRFCGGGAWSSRSGLLPPKKSRKSRKTSASPTIRNPEIQKGAFV